MAWRGSGGTRYSPLTQITPDNVAQLRPAWTFHTGDIADGKDSGPTERIGSYPSGRRRIALHLTTSFNRVVALDPATGQQLWAYNPEYRREAERMAMALINRGLAAWRDPMRRQECAARCRLFRGDSGCATARALMGRQVCPARTSATEWAASRSSRDVTNYLAGPVPHDGATDRAGRSRRCGLCHQR